MKFLVFLCVLFYGNIISQVSIDKRDTLYKKLFEYSYKTKELSQGDAYYIVTIVFAQDKDSIAFYENKKTTNGIFSFQIKGSHYNSHIFTVNKGKIKFVTDDYKKGINELIDYSKSTYKGKEYTDCISRIFYYYYKEAIKPAFY